MPKDPYSRLRKRLGWVSDDAHRALTTMDHFDSTDHVIPWGILATVGGVGFAFGGVLSIIGSELAWPFLLQGIPVSLVLWGWFKAWQRSQRKRITVTPEVQRNLKDLVAVLGRLKALESEEARQLEVTVLEVAESMVSVGRVLRDAGPHDADSVAAQHAELRAVTDELTAATTALEEALAHQHHVLVVKAELAAGADTVSAMRRASSSARAGSEAVRDVSAAALEEVLAVSPTSQVEVSTHASAARSAVTN